MSNEEIDSLVIGILSTESGAVGINWIEVRLWYENFDHTSICIAPTTFDVRDAVWRLKESGIVEMNPRCAFKLKDVSK